MLSSLQSTQRWGNLTKVKQQVSGSTKRSRFFWFQSWDFSSMPFLAHTGFGQSETDCNLSSMSVLLPFRNMTKRWRLFLLLLNLTQPYYSVWDTSDQDISRGIGAGPLLLNMEPYDYHVNEPRLASGKWTEVPQQTAWQLPDMWRRPSKTTQDALPATTWVSLRKTERTAQTRQNCQFIE